MLAIFSKIVEKYDQHLFFHPISMKIFLGTNQTILRKKMLLLNFFVEILFFYVWGASLARTPGRGCALGPTCFWIESEQFRAQRHISEKFQKIFFLKVKKKKN